MPEFNYYNPACYLQWVSIPHAVYLPGTQNYQQKKIESIVALVESL